MGQEIVKVTVYMPQRIYRAAKHASDLVGQSTSNFIVMATAQRVRNWRDPLSGEKVGVDVDVAIDRGKAAGWECDHPACGGPASSCRKPEEHREDYWITWDPEDVDQETGAMLSYRKWDGTVVSIAGGGE